MVREVLVTLALAATFVAMMPLAPALPTDCTAALVAEETLQNDAESGDDAPDAAPDALRIHYDDYYWGYLSVADHGPRSDVADRYVFFVPPGTERVMANVIVSAPGIPNEAYLPDIVERFYLTLTSPDGASRTVSSEGGIAIFDDPISGDHLIEVSARPTGVPLACTGDPGDANTPGTTIARNHGLYVGCDPVCAAPRTNMR